MLRHVRGNYDVSHDSDPYTKQTMSTMLKHASVVHIPIRRFDKAENIKLVARQNSWNSNEFLQKSKSSKRK